MSNTAPEEVVHGLITDATTVKVYKGPVQDGAGVPDESIFCLATGGRAPESFFGQDPQQHKFKAVQVRVRSNKHSFKAGRELSQTVWDALKNKQPPNWFIIRMVNSDAIYLGRDDEDRHEWSINVVAEIIE